MASCKRLLLIFLAVALAGVLAWPLAQAQDKPKDKPPADPGLTTASQAIQLAMEGSKRKSPTLMLAAAELLGGLKEAPPGLKDVQVKVEGPEAKAEKKPLPVSVAAWVDLAREFAKPDKELSTLVDKRLDQLSKRGIVWSYGRDLPSITKGGVTFKILRGGLLGPNQTIWIRGVPYEARKAAGVVVIGDGDGDLDLWVYSSRSGAQVGQDTDASSRCAVTWLPLEVMSVDIKVTNVGPITEQFFILGNW